MTLPEPPCKLSNPESLISNGRPVLPLESALRTVSIPKCTSVCATQNMFSTPVHPFPDQTAALASISTLAFSGKVFTAKQARAGGSELKYLPAAAIAILSPCSPASSCGLSEGSKRLGGCMGGSSPGLRAAHHRWH